MRTTRYQSRDFGVLEIIISVAILAAFSVFVLKLFVSASNDEKKMKQLDLATHSAVTYIEQFKSSSSPYEICSTLGAAAPTSGSFKKTVFIDEGIQAVIEISEDSQNAAGSIYTMNIDMQKSTGESVYKLNGLKYFERVK
jgi:type II secretory pathway pseudopilin PulG